MTEVDLRQGFEAATRIAPDGSGGYTAELDQNWSAVGNLNGGYLQAIMARAAAAGSVHPHVVAATTHFLRSPDAGAAQLVVDPLRTGRSASQVRVRLLQDGEPKAETVFMLGDLTDVSPEATFTSAAFPARVWRSRTASGSSLRGRCSRSNFSTRWSCTSTPNRSGSPMASRAASAS